MKKVKDYIFELVSASEKPQYQIASESGFEKPNLITMIKQGKTKVPIPKIPRLARSLGVDPSKLMYMAMREYEPEKLEVIQQTIGDFLTNNEKFLINELRDAMSFSDPSFSTQKNRDALRQFIQKLLE